jgi:hypothetical protein
MAQKRIFCRGIERQERGAVDRVEAQAEGLVKDAVDVLTKHSVIR